MSESTPQLPLGLSEEAWLSIGAKAVGSEWHIPELSADGEIIGWSRRLADGTKTFKWRGKRGLTLHWPLATYAGSSPHSPVFIVEGASDTAAGVQLQLDIVGRPSANGGVALLEVLLKGLHVCIIGENDESGAGHTGAIAVAAGLIGKCRSVKIIYPPAEFKDLREWMIGGATKEIIELEASNAEVCEAEPLNGEPLIIRMADVVSEEIQWLWCKRLALGKLNLVSGDPGLGKSFVTLDIAARVSRGDPWPDGNGERQPAGGVVLLSAEDGIADTIRPRLDAANADTNRIVVLNAIRSLSPRGQTLERQFDLTRDIAALEMAIKSVESCRLVIIDPVTAYLGGTDGHKNADIRGLLAPLSQLAAKYLVAMVAVTHLNKSNVGPAIYRAMGSVAFTAAARSAWVVSKDPKDPARRLMLPVKNNIAKDTGGLAYRIESSGIDSARVSWDSEPVYLTADEALGSDRGSSRSSGALDEAKEWLRDHLQNGPLPANEIKLKAANDGITKKTLERAKEALGIEPARQGFAGGGQWTWALPS